MLGTFGFRPKGTMSARALGIASALVQLGHTVRIATVPWDNPADAGHRSLSDGVECVNTSVVRPALAPISIAQLLREAHQFQPNLIYVFKPKGFGDLAARILRARGMPVILDMDDWEGNGGWNDALPYSRIERALFDWQERTAPKYAALISTASRTLQQRAAELGADESRIIYLPNGLTQPRLDELMAEPTEKRQAYEGLSRSTSSKILVYTRFVEFAADFLVDVLAWVRRREPGARLVIAGHSQFGDAERRLSERARSEGLDPAIDNLGWISPDQLGTIARQCDVAIVPFNDTAINRAKCSVKLLELMATGIPIVASNVGENREYLDYGALGQLARPGSANDHSDRIVSVFRDPEPAQQMAKNAQQRVKSTYRWPRLVQESLCDSIRNI